MMNTVERVMNISSVGLPNDDDLKQLGMGLREYNQTFVQPTLPAEKLGTFIKSDTGEVLGGCYGVINWGWLYIDWLWCHESIRGQGFGTQLIRAMENYALAKGIHHVKLETADFQALGFYQKLGYCIYGELENYPIGHTAYCLKKVMPAP